MNEDELVVALIQARMRSTRLPGKVLADIAGRPMLWHVACRVCRARRVDRVVVATSAHPADDVIATFCERSEIACFRGDEEDVLDRFYQAARKHGADVVVRITTDCPLIDPHVIDRVVETRAASGCDYATNTLRDTYPDGLDVEVFTFAALERTWREATKASEREHVTPYIRLSGRFRLCNIENEEAPRARGQRWTVDDPVDLEFVRGVYQALADVPHFGQREVLALLERQPSLRSAQGKAIMNEGYYRSLLEQAEAGPAPKRLLSRSEELLSRAQKVIPGCAQTFSKGYNQHVRGVAPIYLERGKGARVWDVDGNEYIDYVQGLLPNILGYAHDEVNAAVAAQLAQGHSFPLPHPLEVELAERLTRLIPCAEMVRFGKNGSDATAGAVRVARAFTGRDAWPAAAITAGRTGTSAARRETRGVPEAVRETDASFPYNDLDSSGPSAGRAPGRVRGCHHGAGQLRGAEARLPARGQGRQPPRMGPC